MSFIKSYTLSPEQEKIVKDKLNYYSEKHKNFSHVIMVSDLPKELEEEFEKELLEEERDKCTDNNK